MSDSSTAVLECRDVTRRFREGGSTLEVLSGVSLVVNAAERVAIIGASGSGKTTLLQIMGGLDDPSSGEVFVNGRSMAITDEAEKGRLRNRYLGFVFARGRRPEDVEHALHEAERHLRVRVVDDVPSRV